MSYISIIVPAFHLNTTDKNDIFNYCCSQFNITQDNFSLIEFTNDQFKDNINYGIIFNESNLSLHKIEQLIYERNCIQNLSEKAFESLQLLSKKISDLENIINNIREEKKNCEKKYNKEILKIENMSNSSNNNTDENFENNNIQLNNNIELTEKSISKIKQEFKNVADDIELLNSNNKAIYIQKDIVFDNNQKEEKDKTPQRDEIITDG
jgi:hypothetical protein